MESGFYFLIDSETMRNLLVCCHQNTSETVIDFFFFSSSILDQQSRDNLYVSVCVIDGTCRCTFLLHLFTFLFMSSFLYRSILFKYTCRYSSLDVGVDGCLLSSGDDLKSYRAWSSLSRV